MPKLERTWPTRFETTDPVEVARYRRAWINNQAIHFGGRQVILTDFAISPEMRRTPEGDYIISRASITLHYLA